jgi:hypothetical protein
LWRFPVSRWATRTAEQGKQHQPDSRPGEHVGAAILLGDVVAAAQSGVRLEGDDVDPDHDRAKQSTEQRELSSRHRPSIGAAPDGTKSGLRASARPSQAVFSGVERSVLSA